MPSEEEVERESVTSELVTEAGKRIIKIKLSTGKTSAGKLFGKHGKGGRPDFFRIVFGAVANGLRSSLGSEEGEAKFNELRNKSEFRKSLNQVYKDIRDWFFNEAIKQYNIGKGDVFAILTELDLDLDAGELKWVRENSQVIYWVRSDKIRVTESCSKVEEELRKLKEDYDKLREENIRLRNQNEELSKKLANVKARVSELVELLGNQENS
ncbi:transcription factor [Caldivirga sp. UBA161]|uniref:transcription factor n=1 Tax=Caldivirga sp. UBA161 TaxID=1915569 RepID=UPI0025BE5FA5|nr:transcription factor [Caldivirga sp. UBA161]